MMTSRTRDWSFRLCTLLAATLLALVTTPTAQAQDDEDYLRLAKNLATPASGTKDAAALIFDAIIDMDELRDVPDGFFPHEEFSRMLLITPDSPQWAATAEWAAAAPQQAVIEAVNTVTEPDAKYELGIGLGRNEMDQKYIDAGLWIDLGEPELLAGMDYVYGARFQMVFYLLSVEAERLALEDDAEGAMDCLVDWLRLARIWTDRPFASEKIRAIMQMIYAMERMRDLAFTYPDLASPDLLDEVIEEHLEGRVIRQDQIRLPEGDFLAAKQVAQLGIDYRGGPNDQFPLLMARVTAKRPLMLFQEAAFWQDLAAGHAEWFDVQDQIAAIKSDWDSRWNRKFVRDPFHQKITTWQATDKNAYAMFEPIIDAVENLFWMRSMFYTEIGGTRTALGLAAFRSANRNLPKTAKAIQPRFRRFLDLDIFSFDRQRERMDQFRYFVPIRDIRWGPRDIPTPHDLTVHSHYIDPMVLLENVRYTTSIVMLPGGATGPDLTGVGGMSAADLGLLDDPQIREFLDFMSEIPDGAINWDTLEADLDVMLEVSNRSAETQEIAQEDLAGMNMMLGLMRMNPNFEDLNLSRENASDFMAGFTDQIKSQMRNDPSLDAMGVSASSMESLIDAFGSAAANSDDLIDVANRMFSGSGATERDMRDLGIAINEIVFTDEVWGGIRTVVNEARQGPGGDVIESLIDELRTGEQSLAAAFPMTVDDSEFILYSVGWNDANDRARTIHPLSGDILIWPPVLSLTKMHAAGVNAVEGDDDE